MDIQQDNLGRIIRDSPLSRARGFGFFMALLLPSLLLTSGCEESGLGPIDSSGLPPYVKRANVRPDTVKLRTITPVNGKYPISADLRMFVEDADGVGDLAVVEADIYFPASVDIVASVPLADNGSGPDSTAKDSVYSGTVRFEVTLAEAGPYRVRFRARDRGGLESNIIDRTLFIDRDNSPPVISDLTAPDTLTLPVAPDSLRILMTVKVTDPDGPADIKEVFFRSLDSSDPTRKFPLYDNGEPSNGDAVEGDGIYSIIVVLPPDPSLRKTYRFLFQALDTVGEASNSILHYLTVR